jgi:hypothetical protein
MEPLSFSARLELLVASLYSQSLLLKGVFGLSSEAQESLETYLQAIEKAANALSNHLEPSMSKLRALAIEPTSFSAQVGVQTRGDGDVYCDDQFIGFRGPGDRLFLKRCPECAKENYALAVSSGMCAWCGWNKDGKI